jgi:hypothetical protein
MCRPREIRNAVIIDLLPAYRKVRGRAGKRGSWLPVADFFRRKPQLF